MSVSTDFSLEELAETIQKSLPKRKRDISGMVSINSGPFTAARYSRPCDGTPGLGSPLDKEEIILGTCFGQ